MDCDEVLVGWGAVSQRLSVQAWLAASYSADKEQRSNALRAIVLSRLSRHLRRSRRVARRCLQMLDDGDKRTVMRVVLALHYLQAEGAVAALLRLLAAPEFQDWRLCIIDALGHQRDATAAPALLECLRDPLEHPFVRAGSVRALARVDPGSSSELATLADGGHYFLRFEACRGLVRLGSPLGPPALRAYYEDPEVLRAWLTRWATCPVELVRIERAQWLREARQAGARTAVPLPRSQSGEPAFRCGS